MVMQKRGRHGEKYNTIKKVNEEAKEAMIKEGGKKEKKGMEV